jgi:actin-related protein 6
VTESDQILVMNNERFTVPEILFHPDDIGMFNHRCLSFFDLYLFLGLDQSGLAATIALSISHLPQDLQGMFWANIGLIGGNTKFLGFRNRLYVSL